MRIQLPAVEAAVAEVPTVEAAVVEIQRAEAVPEAEAHPEKVAEAIHLKEAVVLREVVQPEETALHPEVTRSSMHRHIQRNVRRAVILLIPVRAKAAGQRELRMTAPTTARIPEQKDRQRMPETKVHR